MLSWLVVWNINFIFPYIGNNHPNWLIFFRGVQTTNQCQIFKSLKTWLLPFFSLFMTKLAEIRKPSLELSPFSRRTGGRGMRQKKSKPVKKGGCFVFFSRRLDPHVSWAWGVPRCGRKENAAPSNGKFTIIVFWMLSFSFAEMFWFFWEIRSATKRIAKWVFIYTYTIMYI